MSTDPYPEVTGDESGIVPPQSGRASEWPKKIRTLTASELDRLTIDGNGRFYWDGKLVNYDPPEGREPRPATKETQDDQSAINILDRAVHDLGERSGTDQAERVNQDPSSDDAGYRRAVDFDAATPASESSSAALPATVAVAPHVTQIGPDASERVRVKLSLWQSLGLFVLVLCIAIGALGVAFHGFVAAYEWGCRTGMIQSNCPAPASPKPPARVEIPA